MADRVHGTHNCYVHGPDRTHTGRGCRCEPCRAANTRYERDRARRVTPSYVAADTARRHVHDLAAAGVGLKTIAKRTGIAHGTLTKLIYGDAARGMGPSKRIRKATEDAILAVTPAHAADGAKIDATPTWANIDLLVARGWTKTAIARQLGQKVGGLQLSRNLVQARHARTIAGLLDQPVPARTTRWGTTYQPADRTQPDDLEGEARRAQDAERQRKHRGTLAPILEGLLPGPDEGDTTWMPRGACRAPGVPTWLFFPGRGDNETVQRAKAVCATCPVAADCLAYAERTGQREGVWGGLTAHQRRQARQAARTAA